MPPALDSATLRAVIAQVERQLAEMDRRSGNCALCKSAELKQHLGWLRGTLARGPG
jgi:hypothetical protein